VLLITGGAGYVGRHVARLVGKDVVALDDLRNSSRKAIDPVPLIQVDLAVANVEWPRFDAVVHCAGSIEVSESVRDPGLFWWNNVGAPARFFREARGRTLVFSSTAAVYGEPVHLPISEEHPLKPINPYGWTKLAAEQMFRDLGVKLTILRYFNCAGGDEDHRPESHLIPRVVDAAIRGEPAVVYGDGSNVRDFIHVEDLAEAHLRALDVRGTFNLGSGRGASVREVIETARRVTGRKIDVRHEAARPGDPKMLVADNTRARRELGWSPRRTLDDIIASCYEWRKAHPDGYGR